ncbi:MAG: nucleotidyltransferase family protein [Prevotellaceae bacterium]|nr:nucleotidyltransferase family protein [Candidatus Faecinaster equi]
MANSPHTSVLTPTEERLLALLRFAISSDAQNVQLFEHMTNEEWNKLYRLCVEQGVIAVAYDGMKMLPEELQPIIDIRVQWGFNVENIERKAERQREVAQQITNAFLKEGVRTMILKGLSISQFYNIPSHRQFGDIDIFLMGDHQKGNEIAKRKGAVLKDDFFVHTTFTVHGIEVENHKLFVNSTINRTGKDVEEYLESQAKNFLSHSLIEEAYSPTPDFNLIFLIRHSSYHYARECIRMRDVIDWAFFLKRNHDKISEKAIDKLIELKLDRYTSILTQICEKHLGLANKLPISNVDASLSEKVLMDILRYKDPNRHYHGNVLTTFLKKITTRRKRKWCYDEVVPDQYYGNILSSVLGYIKHPKQIFRSRV